MNKTLSHIFSTQTSYKPLEATLEGWIAQDELGSRRPSVPLPLCAAMVVLGFHEGPLNVSPCSASKDAPTWIASHPLINT
jgi:hypothetical protein